MLSLVGNPNYLKYGSKPWPYCERASVPFGKNTVYVALVPAFA